jgi:hypothetical protein
MLPKNHIIYGAIFSILISLSPQISFFQGIVIFLASFLIDVDHYLYYVYKKKDFNLKNSFKWFTRNREKFLKMNEKEKEQIYMGLCFLHGIETIVILILLSIMPFIHSNIFLFVALGFIFHQAVDAIDLYRKEYRFDKVISFFYAVKKSKNKSLLQDL